MLIDYMLLLISDEPKTYLSFDRSCSLNGNLNRPDDVHTPNFFNPIFSSGLSNHELKLKIYVPIILLRNIDQYARICNDT